MAPEPVIESNADETIRTEFHEQLVPTPDSGMVGSAMEHATAQSPYQSEQSTMPESNDPVLSSEQPVIPSNQSVAPDENDIPITAMKSEEPIEYCTGSGTNPKGRIFLIRGNAFSLDFSPNGETAPVEGQSSTEPMLLQDEAGHSSQGKVHKKRIRREKVISIGASRSPEQPGILAAHQIIDRQQPCA